MKQVLFAAFFLLSLAARAETDYEYKETRELVALVTEAAVQVQRQGEIFFNELRKPGSQWRQGERYVFVLDLAGNMLVHPDPAIEGKNQMKLKDVQDRPIVRGIIASVTTLDEKADGWYHYEWPVPGEILPRWKSTYSRLVMAPSGRSFVVSSGMYNDRMEKSFVVDMVRDAAGLVAQRGKDAFSLFRDRTGRFMAKDAYIFVVDPDGVELVNPAFPNLEGRGLLDAKDDAGKYLFREMLELARTRGSGWIEYMWPKPGESVSTRKSSYVMRAKLGERWVLVGCGVYLADAPRGRRTGTAMKADELVGLVREGAALLEKKGPAAFPEFRTKGSKWFKDDTYFFVWSMDGIRRFHAADPSLEGKNGSDAKDILGKPYGKMFLDAAQSPSGEGWVHYMYPEPGRIFPAWKSAFIKRVVFPDGKPYLVGSAVYSMRMDAALIEAMVDQAVMLIEKKGRDAFSELRDKKGPFVFMDTYIFVDTPSGEEIVNPAFPSLEGRNILALKDAKGKEFVREYLEGALRNGRHWEDYDWYKPGTNTPAPKRTFVRKVEAGGEIYIVGSGLYLPEETP